MYIALCVLVSALAVFGLYCSARVILCSLAGQDSLSVAIRIRDERELEDIEILLDGAHLAAFYPDRRRVYLIFDTQLWSRLSVDTRSRIYECGDLECVVACEVWKSERGYRRE